jgi:uncharacterized RDD family membrane protein YckC
MNLEVPSLKRRLACWLYEGVLLFGVLVIAAYLFSALTQSKHALTNRAPMMAFLFVVLAVYFCWFWAKGQTLAQKTWLIKVTDRLGQPIGQARAFGRYVLSWIWLLPPLAAAGVFKWSTAETLVLTTGWVVIYAVLARFAPQQQFWHDVLAGTRLVHAPPPEKK